MNRWLRPGLMFAFLLCSSLLFANRVIVKGTVKFANGIIVPNFPVVVQTDTTTSNTDCRVYKSVVSNLNAFYEAALECSSPILKVVILYKDCNGILVRTVKEVPATAVIEYNIVLCTPTACHSNFSFSGNNTNPRNILFNSINSSAVVGYLDEIVSRVWTWG